MVSYGTKVTNLGRKPDPKARSRSRAAGGPVAPSEPRSHERGHDMRPVAPSRVPLGSVELPPASALSANAPAFRRARSATPVLSVSSKAKPSKRQKTSATPRHAASRPCPIGSWSLLAPLLAVREHLCRNIVRASVVDYSEQNPATAMLPRECIARVSVIAARSLFLRSMPLVRRGVSRCRNRRWGNSGRLFPPRAGAGSSWRPNRRVRTHGPH